MTEVPANHIETSPYINDNNNNNNNDDDDDDDDDKMENAIFTGEF